MVYIAFRKSRTLSINGLTAISTWRDEHETSVDIAYLQKALQRRICCQRTGKTSLPMTKTAWDERMRRADGLGTPM